MLVYLVTVMFNSDSLFVIKVWHNVPIPVDQSINLHVETDVQGRVQGRAKAAWATATPLEEELITIIVL